jgi:hypothetical protein
VCSSITRVSMSRPRQQQSTLSVLAQLFENRGSYEPVSSLLVVNGGRRWSSWSSFRVNP